MTALPADVATVLAGVILRASDDTVKSDLEVCCRDCDAVLCDAEAGDTLDVLAGIALDHQDECVAAPGHRSLLDVAAETWPDLYAPGE